MRYFFLSKRYEALKQPMSDTVRMLLTVKSYFAVNHHVENPYMIPLSWSSSIGSRDGIGACLVPSHYLNQY